jgi:hypothetical protein
MVLKSKWICITAGVGSKSFEEAAIRLVEQVETFNVFDKTYAVLTDELHDICPDLFEWFPKDEISEIKGYGWYAWKSAISLAALSGRWGDFDGIAYFDSGCEFFLSRPSKKRLLKYIAEANKNGHCFFSIETPESCYTKRDLFDYFPSIDPLDRTNQFQSGSWFLSRPTATEFIPKWNQIVWVGPHQVDESPSVLGESDGFQVHRYDQSVFSLLAKEMNLDAVSEIPPGKSGSLQFYFRAFFYPFWWSRNRTGVRSVPKLIQFFGKLTISLPLIFAGTRKFRDYNSGF